MEVGGLTISASPEYPEGTAEVDANAEKGKFDTKPSNGDFRLSWTQNNLEVFIRKCGDGLGGDVHAELPLTPALANLCIGP